MYSGLTTFNKTPLNLMCLLLREVFSSCFC